MNVFIAHAVATLTALFPVANPIGAVPIFLTLTEGDSASFRRRQARSTALNVIAVLVVFFLVGKFLLHFFGVSLGVLQIAGGLVVGHTAWGMVTTQPKLTTPEHQEALAKTDVSFTPMAMPLVAGPGAIGVVIGMSEQVTGWQPSVGSLLGILLLGGVLYALLRLGQPLVQVLGHNGMGVLNRVLGFFVLAIAVQLVVNGVIAILRPYFPTVFTQ
jgi:multiple antibiotic resistance protein